MTAQRRYEVEGWPGSAFWFTVDEVEEGVEGRFEVQRDGWIVSGLGVDLDGQFVVKELCFRPAQDLIPPGGVSVTTLNLPIGRLRAGLQRTLVKHVREKVRESLASRAQTASRIVQLQDELAAHRGEKRRGRRPYSDDELEAIALLYLDIQETNGVNRIAEDLALRLDTTVSTVNKKVRRATDAGFLGPAHQGRGGRRPGPRLTTLGAH